MFYLLNNIFEIQVVDINIRNLSEPYKVTNELCFICFLSNKKPTKFEGSIKYENYKCTMRE